MSKRTSKRADSIQRRQTRWGYIFLTPTILGLLLFCIGPIFVSLFLSFTDWNMIGDVNIIGGANYSRMVKDPLVLQSMKVTLYYTLLVVPGVNIATLFLASLLNSKIKGLSVYRTALYIPSMVPAVASSALWMFIFNPTFGLANALLEMVGLPTSDWLYDADTVIPSLAFITIWSSGNTIVIYLAGLQGLPNHLYEAATVDGAGAFRKFWNITVPLLSPVIFYNVVISIINSMQNFTSGYIMTKGGPNNASLFYMLHLYRTAFTNQEMGYACAMAWVLFVVIGAFTAINFVASKKWVYYETGGQ